MPIGLPSGQPAAVMETFMKKGIILTLAMVAAAASHASFTVATFADPSNSSTNPLFSFNANTSTLTGGWSGTGLTLQTPGLIGGGSLNDVKFVMTPITTTNIGPGVFVTNGGNIKFYTSDINNPDFTVNFDSAILVNPLNFGTSEFIGSNVSFTGPNVPSGLSEESFGFTFANQRVNQGVYTYTAAFTSSAVPEPATMIAIATGIAGVVARRRRASK